MIAVKKAEKIILDHVRPFPAERRSLMDACGAVLRENIYADRDLPPFNKALMDGIAINLKALSQGIRRFKIEGMQSAGSSFKKLKSKKNCIEICTGAALPAQCDGVIPVEKLSFNNGSAIVKKKVRIKRFQHVKSKGGDHKKNALLLKEGMRVMPPQVAVAASVGRSTLKVSKTPRIAIVSTGDELVDIDAPIQPYQIRKSNSYALQSIFHRHGFSRSDVFHVRDNKSQIKVRIEKILREYDVLVLTGGVSMGKFDYVPAVLSSLKVKVLFHKIAQRPGKPFWFGQSSTRKPVFALPGNPVSTQICAYRYVLPYLKRAVGQKNEAVEYGVLARTVETKTKFTVFAPVKIATNRKGQLCASPVESSGSGDFVSVALADGFVELPAADGRYKKGTSCRLFRW